MRPRNAILMMMMSLLSLSIIAGGQDTMPVSMAPAQKRMDDSVKAVTLFRAAESYSLTNQTDSVMANIARSLEIASLSDFPLIMAMNFELLGLQYDRLSDWEGTLRNYLKASSIYKNIGRSDKEALICGRLAARYFDMGIYSKSATYYEKEFSLYNTGSENLMAKASEGAAMSLFYLPADSLSVKWFIVAAQLYEKISDKDGITRCTQRIAALYIRLGAYESAGEKYDLLLRKFTARDDADGVARIYNDLGFLKFRLNNFTGAIDEFRKAAETSEKGGSDPGFLTGVYSNIAICHQTTGQEQAMMDNFKIALGLARESGREEEVARLSHILSVIYFRKEDNYHAELYCQDCISSAKKASGHDVLQECYQTYSDVAEKGNDFVKALEYYEKYLSIRDSMNFENRLKEQKELDRHSDFDALEQRLQLEIADEEISGLEIKTLRAESSRKENELKLLMKQQELDRSEKDRLAQSLVLEKERYRLTLRDREVRSLQQQQRIDSLLIKQKENEAVALDRENKALEREKQQQELDIQKQKQIKRLAVGLVILMVIVAIMILVGLISTRRKNQKLAVSKRQIEKINADLEIKNTEIIRQKDIIEQKNQSITDSIQYASRIQEAVLPPINFLSDWGIENFILLKPKDIVSGDFYWGMRKKGKIIIAAADCTGHGVPGAFMSMLGHAFLDEIMNTTEVTDAAMVLNSLRDEVINTLKQRGMVGETRDGMDISLCIIDQGSRKLEFAGANNPLYIIRDNKLIKVPADKMPIGIHVTTLSPFTNNTIAIEKDDILYLFSDGFADQFGGAKGKKFMYKPFQELLLKNHLKPLEMQKIILDEAFTRWKGEREQVDDVLVIGMKL